MSASTMGSATSSPASSRIPWSDSARDRGLGERAGQVVEGAGEKSDVGQLEKDRRVVSILYGVVRRTSESAKEPANRKGTPDASDGHREGNQGVGSGDQAR